MGVKILLFSTTTLLIVTTAEILTTISLEKQRKDLKKLCNVCKVAEFQRRHFKGE